MSPSETPGRPPGLAAAPWLGPLTVAVLMQIALSFLTRVIPVIGPVVTEDAGVPPEWIGHLAALNTLGMMIFLMIGAPVLHRFGPVRAMQIGGLFGAAGLLLTLTGIWPLLMLSSLLMGLGYGVTAPAGSDILARSAPARHRAMIFSIKQAGMPLGGVIAGLAVPWLFVLVGWKQALMLGAVPVVLAALAVQPLRNGIDGPRDLVARLTLSAFLSVANFLRPFGVLKTTPALIRLSFAGIALAIAQGCLFSFQATFLNVELGLSLAAAGTLFALTQGIGVFGRVFAGWAADRLGSGARALVLLSIGSAAMMFVTATIGPGWSWSALLVWSVVTGVAVGTWNGVYLSEIAALSPRDQVAEATAGSTFLCFIGYVVGPFTFSVIVAWTGTYWPAYVAAGIPPLLTAVMLARAGGR